MSLCVVARGGMCVYARASTHMGAGNEEMQIQALTCEMFTQA